MSEIPTFVKKMKHTATITGAVTYRLSCDPPDGFGWALATVNDATGEVAITSDWGNWSYRWHIDHLGGNRAGDKATLTEFIGERHPGDCDYLANKLTSYAERHIFDLDDSVKALQRIVCEQRLQAGREHMTWRKHHFDKDTARELFDAIGELGTHDYKHDDLIRAFFEIDGHERITEEPWEHTVHKPGGSYYQLKHGILPALVEACFAVVYPGRHRCDLSMSRSDGAGHWRDFHRGHNCHLDPTPIAQGATP